MRPQSADTNPEVERIHIGMLRQAGVARRFELTRSLSATAMELSREAIRQRNPDLSDEELRLKFVALCYGEDLARRVQNYLRERRR